MLCFRKFLVAKKFMDKILGGGGSIKISFKKILSHSSKKFRRGTL